MLPASAPVTTTGPPHTPRPAHPDIADRRTAERSIAEGVARFGRIDTLVNNAGIFVAKPFTRYSETDYAAMLGVNLAGFFHMTQLAVAEMEKRGSGHIEVRFQAAPENLPSRIEIDDPDAWIARVLQG